MLGQKSIGNITNCFSPFFSLNWWVVIDKTNTITVFSDDCERIWKDSKKSGPGKLLIFSPRKGVTFWLQIFKKKGYDWQSSPQTITTKIVIRSLFRVYSSKKFVHVPREIHMFRKIM
jgi:hypothetical protein